jgi:TolA-binding protein
MRRIILCLIVASLFAGSSAWAAAGDDDKNAKSNEKSRTSTEKKATEAPKPGANPGSNPGEPATANPALQSEVQQLKQLVQEQADRLRGLQQRLAEVESEVAGKPSTTNTAASVTAAGITAADATTVGATNEGATGAGQPAALTESAGSTAQPAAAPSRAATQEENNKHQEKKPSPLYFEIGRAHFTPGGFVDLTEFTRTKNVGSGIATAFQSVPYNNTLQGLLTETHFSAQYSRLSLKVDAAVTDSTSLTGYVESDFLGFQPANAYITSNSNSLRMRVFWANIKHNKWEVLAGQEWSLLTPNRVGLSPYTPDVFYTFNEDPNFQVGLIWARQAQFRVVYHPTEKLAIGVSAENPQQIAPASVVFPSAAFVPQFDNTSSLTNAASAAINTFVPNLHPDIVVKVAYDWRLMGRPFHVEVGGLIRSFKVFNPFANNTSTITGGAGSVNLNLQVIRNLTLIANSFYGDGGGRYIEGLGPDAIVKANGTLSGVHSGAGLGGLEWTPNRRYNFDAYYGAAYFWRNFGSFPTPGSTCNGRLGFLCVGFGFPGSPNTTNRVIQEATVDVIPTLWSSEEYGRFQVIAQYSYLVRSPWSTLTTPPTPKNAHLSMVYAGIRYILP